VPASDLIGSTADAGFYESACDRWYPNLQLLTIAKLLDGREVEMRDAGSMTSPTLMLGDDEDAP
jgi:hypothetical protein